MASPSEVYSSLLRACPPLAIQGPLGNFELDPFAYAAPDNPAEMLNELLAEYSREDLVFAGAIRPPASPEELPELNPTLLHSAFLAIREAENSAPRHLVLETGCLDGCCLPVVAAADDYRRRDAKGGVRSLLICGSVADAAFLTALGFYATTATGLAQLGGNDLREVGEVYGWRRRGSGPVRTPETKLPRLVLVGWQPATGNPAPPPGFEAVIGHLVRLRRDLQMQIPQIISWTISAEEMSRFAFVTQHGTPPDLQRALRDSANRLGRPLFTDLVPPARRQQTLADVYLGDGNRAIWGDAVDDGKQQATADAAIDNLIVGRLLQEASTCADPIRANTLVLLATLSRAFHQTANQVVWPSARGQVLGDHTTDEAAGRKVDRLLRISNQLERLGTSLSHSHPSRAASTKRSKGR